MPNIDLSILNQRQTPAFYADVFANRPAAGYVGRIFVSTDTFAFYRDNGTGWDLIGGPGTGTITGSGTAGTVPLWNGASTIGNSTLLEGTTKFTTTKDFQADAFYLNGMTAGSGSLYWTSDRVTLANYNPTGTVVIEVAGGSHAQLIAADLSTTFYGNIIRNGGTSSQFLKADGSLDSNTYNTGSGAAGQVSYFNGTNSITGSNDLFWDNVNGHLGVNTNVPGTALDVHHDQNTVAILNQTTATNDVRIGFQNNGVGLWRIGAFYNAGANDFGIYDAVAALQPVTVKKTTGQVLIGTSTVGSGKLVVASTNSDNGVQIVGASAPSLRIDNAESGPTLRAGLGISTGTNNFIQGSANRDFCIFNGTTSLASPILFGIYGTTNVQEAARISAARNFLIGGVTDSGEKLQVNGTTFLSSNVAIGSSGTNDISWGTAGGIKLSRTNVGPEYALSQRWTGSAAFVEIAASSQWNGGVTILPNGGGEVGIGTLTPGSKLDVTNTVGTAYNSANTLISGQTMRISNLSTNSDVAATLLFNATGSGGGNGLGSISGVSTGTGSLALTFAGRNAGASLVEAMRLTGLGNLLIGTTTDAGYKLQVNGSAQATRFTSSETQVSVSATPTVVFDSGGGSGVWLVTVVVTGNPGQIAFAIVGQRFGGTLFLLSSGVGAQIALTVSGNTLLASQTAGGSILTSVSNMLLNQGG